MAPRDRWTATTSGPAIGIGGWHAPAGVARGERQRRAGRARPRRRIGALPSSRAWARGLGYAELMATGQEDDAESLAWAERRGFAEVGRNSRLVLDLTAIDVAGVAPPDGIEIVTWAERPELAAGMYEVACEAYPDVPGEEDAELRPFEEWLSMDMQGAGDRPEATFVALAGDEVVGTPSSRSRAPGRRVAMHDMTGVRRAWRGRGIAGALKRAEIAWAKENGLRAPRDAERGAKRADPPAQRAPRLRRRAGLDHRPRAARRSA